MRMNFLVLNKKESQSSPFYLDNQLSYKLINSPKPTLRLGPIVVLI
jgi:hypothetical protein